MQAEGGPGQNYHRVVALMVTIRLAKDEAGEAEFWLEKVPLEYAMGEIEITPICK
jgi:hypothetical protein